MTEKKNRKWTTEEERVLVDQVQRNANNLKEAFRKTARFIDRTEGACQYHWYAVMLKREETSLCFVTIGHKTKNINRKNVASNTSDNTEKTSASWWKRFLSFLKK